MELLVQPHGRMLQVSAGANLLNVLREHEVPVSYSCMAGRCGTCRCRVLDGEVHEAGREIKLTNPLESAYVLACRSTMLGDCTIEIPEPDEVVVHPARVFKARVANVERLTQDVVRLRLKANRAWSHSPGQYAMLQFAPDLIRPYSMAGLCGDELIEFHIRLVPGGRASEHVGGSLKAGDEVRVSGPMGTAYLRTRHEGPMLCVAGGTGLAPVLSVVRGALQAGMRNPIHLYFGVRTRADAYGLAWLDELADRHDGLRVHLVVAAGSADAGHRSGLVTHAVAADWSGLGGWRVYLCGAPPMVEAGTFLARRLGADPEHIHADAFYTAGT